MSFPRAAGILLHPTSLPSRGGIGDLGPAAYEFADFLAAAKQALWQILALWSNRLRILPLLLHLRVCRKPSPHQPGAVGRTRMADRARVSGLTAEVKAVNYETIFRAKMPLLFEAARTFVTSASGNARARFDAFCQMPVGGSMTSFSSMHCGRAIVSSLGTVGPRS